MDSILDQSLKLHGPLDKRMAHLCIDMQRLFAPGGPWPTPWMERTLPVIVDLAGRFADRTIFTRFIPPVEAEDVPGTWRRFYRRWDEVTRRRLDPRLLELVPGLAGLAPPASVVDRASYSGFGGGTLDALLAERGVTGLIVTGAETDICVLATVLGAVDRGYRVVIVSDAVCSSSDQGHDALIGLFQNRFSEQIEVADAATIRAAWD